MKNPNKKYCQTHGCTGSPVYLVWMAMKQRCFNKKAKRYADYGGRGITVCDRWKNSFESFMLDMGERPSDAHSIERRRVNGNYEPNNCFWATNDVQQSNKRNNKRFEYNGDSKTQSEWVRVFGIKGVGNFSRMIKGGKTFTDIYNFYTSKQNA